jgi:hypothetical protein
MDLKNKLYDYETYLNTSNDISEVNIPEDENDMDLIIPNIWLGNYRAAYNKQELDAHNIRYIINITDKIQSPFSDKKYLIIPIRDKKVCELHFQKYMIQNILKSFKFIDEAINNNSQVLIHCRKGHHRSANLVLFYLIYKYNIGYIPALIYINSIRKYALIRDTCINKWGIEIYKLLIEHRKK